MLYTFGSYQSFQLAEREIILTFNSTPHLCANIYSRTRSRPNNLEKDR